MTLISGFILHLPNVDFKCNTCIVAKSHRISYLASLNKNVVIFFLIHSNVWGPSSVTAPSGYRWFVIFVNDCTRITWVYQMKTKVEVFLRPNSQPRYEFFGSKMVGSLLINTFRPISNTMVYSTKHLAPRPHNKMVFDSSLAVAVAMAPFNSRFDSPATAPFDSCPIGVSADSCPASAP